MLDNPEGLPLALLHFRRPRAVFLDRRHPAPRCFAGYALSSPRTTCTAAASCAPSSTTSGGHDQDFAHSARKKRRQARNSHFAGSQNSSVEKDRDSVDILNLKHVFPAARGLASAWAMHRTEHRVSL